MPTDGLLANSAADFAMEGGQRAPAVNARHGELAAFSFRHVGPSCLKAGCRGRRGRPLVHYLITAFVVAFAVTASERLTAPPSCSPGYGNTSEQREQCDVGPLVLMRAGALGVAPTLAQEHLGMPQGSRNAKSNNEETQ